MQYQNRGWQEFHTARNICLALSGEAGELCELFQFKDEDCCSTGLPGWTRDARDKLAQVSTGHLAIVSEYQLRDYVTPSDIITYVGYWIYCIPRTHTRTSTPFCRFFFFFPR